MVPDEPPASEADSTAALADLIRGYRPDSRPLRQVIAMLTEGPQDIATLIQRSAVPRQTVESILACTDGDLLRDGDKVGIRPDRIAAYRKRFGYDQLARTRLTDPLAARLAEAAPILESMRELVAAAPAARTDLDHVAATPETVLRRALWLDSRYDLAGATLLFAGDHDLTSLAVGQVSPDAGLVVVDIDEATLEFIDRQARRLGIGVRCLAADLRFGLPERAVGCADLVFTDPPYTPDGVELFAARGLAGLGNREHGRVITAYGFSDRHPSLGFGVQSAAHRLGLVYEAMLPRFNRYTGAQAVGSSSDLYVWRPTSRTWKSLDRLGSDGTLGIYTRGAQAVEKEQAALAAVPAEVRAVTADAGFPVRILVGSGWQQTADAAARLRLATLLSGGIPAQFGGREAFAVVADLSADPGPWLLRALLAANADRFAALLPNSHPDLVSEAAQQALAGLIGPKYALRFLRSQPGPRHAIVVAEAVRPEALDVAGRLSRRLLQRAHGKLGNVWREGLIEAAAERGQTLAKRAARAAVEAGARHPAVLDTRLIDLPRHQVAEILADAGATARLTGATFQRA